jgi:repressor LexA
METTRPTKKQQELLLFIDGFIRRVGYGPSYREIMRALGYKSVSTVATHVDNLIARGWLRKRDNSARSLEVLYNPRDHKPAPSSQPDHEKWLAGQVKRKFTEAERLPQLPQNIRDELLILTEALKLLGLEAAHEVCAARLKALIARNPH